MYMTPVSTGYLIIFTVLKNTSLGLWSLELSVQYKNKTVRLVTIFVALYIIFRAAM